MKGTGPLGADHSLVEETRLTMNAIGRDLVFLRKCLVALAVFVGVLAVAVIVCLV